MELFRELFRVSLEAHTGSATIYVAGFLAPQAAGRVDEALRAVPPSARVVRVDLRDVVLIDPAAFVQVARSLNQWRDRCAGRVLIQFPSRSYRAPAHARLAQLSSAMGSAVSIATTWPMSTSPG